MDKLDRVRRLAPHLRGVDTEGLRVRVINGDGQVLGRLASQIATILMGKDKPTYNPMIDQGDIVVVVNAADIEVTGRKLKNKVYYRHTGYPGGIKEQTLQQLKDKNPAAPLIKAVERMLPDNRLRKHRMRKLRQFMGPDHPFDEDLVTPFKMPPRNLHHKMDVEIPEGWQPMNRDLWERRYLRWGQDETLKEDIEKLRGLRKRGLLPEEEEDDEDL